MEELHHLVVAAQQGSSDAFGQIVGRFQDMAFAGAYALLRNPAAAQDAAQDAFIDAYVNLSKLREPAAFPGWFRRIVFKHSDRQMRKWRPTVPLDSAVSLPSPIINPETAVDQRLISESVHDAIALLPPEQRLVTTLFYIQGYSQKEIGAYLELPISTIKKRLYAARRRLKEKLIMVQEQLQANKPSQDKTFADKVQFYIALRQGNHQLLSKILARQPDLVDAKTEWPVASDTYYWPLGVTPLYYVAGMGDTTTVQLLLNHSADVNGAGSDQTPLHHAVIMNQPDAAALLLDHGAAINAATPKGLTPLHAAVIRGNMQMVELLLQRGTAVHTQDTTPHSPMAWAAHKGFTEICDLLAAYGANAVKTAGSSPKTPPAHATHSLPQASTALGRVIRPDGTPLDDGNRLEMQPAVAISITQSAPAMLETGIKIIDLMAPIKRGGHVGVFTPLSGIGRMRLQAQLMESIVSLHDGYIVTIGLERGEVTTANLRLEWRAAFNLPEKVLNERMICVFGQMDDDVATQQQVAETGLTLAEALRQQGHEVLLVVGSKMTLVDGVVPFLRLNTAVSPQAAITTIYDGDHTAGLEPDIFTELDAVLTFDRNRRMQNLWPAVDPLHSRSLLLNRPDLIGQQHVALVTAVHHLFRRYQELHHSYEFAGDEALFYLDNLDADRTTITRARRLHRYLTQPLPLYELITAKPGRLVSLNDVLRDVDGIVNGRYDHKPEEDFLYTDTLT
ncbi:MAG: sigma-70 family RNA polymerase sigma factor [Anaerolineales bacterium]|nr:sigma-70 family RNA polymerase sigma factor [Anaerolineales bacterium]